jgi:Tfp pilus assembly protein FimT
MTELMMVIGVIAIASAIAMPNFISWIPKRKLGTASRDVLGALELARMQAVRSRSNAVIQFPNSTDYMIWVDNGEGGGLRALPLHPPISTAITTSSLTAEAFRWIRAEIPPTARCG